MNLETITIRINKDDPEMYQADFENCVHQDVIVVLHDVINKLAHELEQQEGLQVSPLTGGDRDILNS